MNRHHGGTVLREGAVSPSHGRGQGICNPGVKRLKPVTPDRSGRSTIRYAKAAGQILCGCLGLAALTFLALRLGFNAATAGFCLSYPH